MPVLLPHECLCCGSKNLQPVFSLVDAPLTDIYLASASESLSLKKYPLNLFLCSDCGHLQLSHQVSPEDSYSNYLYTSNTTIGLKQNFIHYARELKSRFSPSPEPLRLLDVGSNDGSFLQAARHEGIDAYGVEPTSVASIAVDNSCPTLNSYFDTEIKSKLKSAGFPTTYHMISFNNVLANIPNPNSALVLAESLLVDQEGIISVQTGYHPTQFGIGLFDYIYHEHYSYFSLCSLAALAYRSDLRVVSHQQLPVRGGSFRMLLQPGAKQFYCLNERFTTLTELVGLHELIHASSSHLFGLLSNLRSEGYKIIGYGASHSTGILVHQFKLTHLIDFLVDENPNKQGLFMPGTSLQVSSPNIIYENLSEKYVIVVLAWQYFDVIRDKLLRHGVKFPILKPVLP